MRPILLATDGSPTAAAATEKAVEIAAALEAPVVVATIWALEYEPIGVGFGSVIPELDRVGHDRALGVAEGAASTLRAAGVDVDVVVRRGVPAQELPIIADEIDAQLVVLGSHGWGPMKRAFFGSVSTSVLHHTRRPVLIVPPQARVAPERRKDTRIPAEV